MPKPGVTKISIRLLEKKSDGNIVLVPGADGYYDFLIKKSELDELMKDSPKENIFYHLAQQYNRSFMEYLMLEHDFDCGYLASVYVDDYEVEFSYVESQYMDNSYMNDSVRLRYDEEIGMLSDFDYYPYGLV
jgi:hypothetical protein